MKGIVVFDFAGTLIDPEIIDEANDFRTSIIDREMPGEDEYGRSEELYENNRQAVSQLTGIETSDTVRYLTNQKQEEDLTGREFLNQMSTDLFRIGMLEAVNRHGKDAYREGIIEEIERIKEKGYETAIVSGVRTDIISGVLHTTGIDHLFDHVMGQPPKLGRSNQEQLEQLDSMGEIEYVIGDNLDDLEAGNAYGATTIYADWGHSRGGETEASDHAISEPAEIENLIS